MAKKLPGEKANPLFLGALKDKEERKEVAKLKLKAAHSKTKTAKQRTKYISDIEKN